MDVVQPRVNVADAIAPNPRTTPVATENIAFTEPIDINTLLPALSLTLGTDPTNLLNGAVSVSLMSGTTSTYQLAGLSGLTTPSGNYTLTIDATQVLIVSVVVKLQIEIVEAYSGHDL